MSQPPVDADAFNAFEAAGWEQQVSGYEDFFGPITTRLVGPLLDAARVLDADGRVALTVRDFPDQARFHGVLVDAVAEAGASSQHGIPVGPPIFRFSDEQEFASLLREQGLDENDGHRAGHGRSNRAAKPPARGVQPAPPRFSVVCDPRL